MERIRSWFHTMSVQSAHGNTGYITVGTDRQTDRLRGKEMIIVHFVNVLSTAPRTQKTRINHPRKHHIYTQQVHNAT